ncbi:MAG TPA: hypothetical protein ENN28_01745 [Candidatus Uhrbacteria bacterium]|nr:hypothetical protein [Candidatus Uhrbacteria bacterium]
MVANTDQGARVISLCGSAIELIQKENRNLEQINKLIQALQEFKDGQSAKPKPLPQAMPGTFNGNRCAKCGGYIDEGGICPCGWDHDRKIKMA